MKNLIKLLLLPCLARDAEEIGLLIRDWIITEQGIIYFKGGVIGVGIGFILFLLMVPLKGMSLVMVVPMIILAVYLWMIFFFGSLSFDRKKRILNW